MTLPVDKAPLGGPAGLAVVEHSLTRQRASAGASAAGGVGHDEAEPIAAVLDLEIVPGFSAGPALAWRRPAPGGVVAKQAEWAAGALLNNRLDNPDSLSTGHGIRLPIDMDGVPYTFPAAAGRELIWPVQDQTLTAGTTCT